MARRAQPDLIAELPASLFADREAARRAAARVEWRFDLHAGQRPIVADRHRFRTVANGRRWGKSFMASWEAVEKANAARGTVLLAAPTYKTAKNGTWAHLIGNLPTQYRKVHAGDMVIELTGGGRVQVGSLDQPDNLRGLGADLTGIIVDEAAFVPDYAVLNVLRPMLMDNNGWLLAISTPKGRIGWFYNYWMRGQSDDPQDRAYASWQAPTWTNPTLRNLDEEIDDLRSSLPSNIFDQEIGAQFVDDAAAVFRNVQLAELAPVPDGDGMPKPRPGWEYYAGVDFARTGRDWSVVTVLGRPRTGGDLQVAWMDRWGRLPDLEQVGRLAGTLQHWAPWKVLAEENSFGGVYVSWMADRYRILVETFTTTAASKGPLITQAAAAFEFGRIDIWPQTHPLGRVLVNELLSYQRTQTASGNYQYSAPEGFHDDCVMSLCLAIRAAEGTPWEGERAGRLEGDWRDYMAEQRGPRFPRSLLPWGWGGRGRRG